MNLKEFFDETWKPEPSLVRPRITCEDGFSISIQGGTWFHYSDCQARTRRYAMLKNKQYVSLQCPMADKYDDIESFELGYPSSLDEKLNEFMEDMATEPAQSPKGNYECIYPFVPKQVVEQLIERHGGILPPENSK